MDAVLYEWNHPPACGESRMHELVNEDGVICAAVDVLPEGGGAWAILVSWKPGVSGLPDARAWNAAVESNLARCRDLGAAAIDSRVVAACEGVPEALAAARAALHRRTLAGLDFAQGEGRVEYRVGIDEAIAALEPGVAAPRLAWVCVDATDPDELARAAGFLRRAAEGDPAFRAGDDALGFLNNLLEEKGTAPAPERIQIGACDSVPAAFLALMAYPADGWSTLYYLGVAPGFRGRGLGAEAMLRGLRCLKAMGGTTYHDGTGSRNAPARALFARLGRPPYRVLEEWRLEK
jgi:ribosomal protein S18 acetylase RimI-like enzyme